MDDVHAEEIPQAILCNTVVAQNDKDGLDVFVNGIRMVGVRITQIAGDGGLVIGLPAHAFRLAGRHESKKPVYETKDNVIAFPLMDEYRARWAAETTPPPEPEPDGAA
jgi:hypothetical protein